MPPVRRKVSALPVLALLCSPACQLSIVMFPEAHMRVPVRCHIVPQLISPAEGEEIVLL